MSNSDRSRLKFEAMANHLQRATGPLGLAPHIPLTLIRAANAGLLVTPIADPCDRRVSTEALAARLQRATGPLALAPKISPTLAWAPHARSAISSVVTSAEPRVSAEALAARLQRATGLGEMIDVVALPETRHILQETSNLDRTSLSSSR